VEKNYVSTGIIQLDNLLGHLCIGDNVIWYDSSGRLTAAFCHEFLGSALLSKRSVIYVAFDKHPAHVLEKLGILSDNELFTIVDCFTWGKGGGAESHVSFYFDAVDERRCRVVRLDDLGQIDLIVDVLSGLISTASAPAFLIFDGWTAMQELWGGEGRVVDFCYQMFENVAQLAAAAYWIVEKPELGAPVRRTIDRMAQVVIELGIRRAKTFLTVIKADGRDPKILNTPFNYSIKNGSISLRAGQKWSVNIELGRRLKEARAGLGLSQAEVARLVGVTPSTISQIESNLIVPSLPMLLEMAEVLSVEPGFFLKNDDKRKQLVFRPVDAKEVSIGQFSRQNLAVKAISAQTDDRLSEIYLVELPPHGKLNSHFFSAKGQEIGCLLSGGLQFTVEGQEYELHPGDVIYLTSETPEQWKNTRSTVAKLLWIKDSRSGAAR
jgi:transcriptional regulator with XRE-family HTH domain